MKRRVFLTAVGAAVGALAGGSWWWLARRFSGTNEDTIAASAPPGPVTAPDGRPVFPTLHRETLRQLVWRLVPDDPESAGAATVGAFPYIERQMALPEMAGARRTAIRGASVLDRVARSKFGTLFSRIEHDAQDAVINAMLAGEGASPKLDSAGFIEMMIGMTLEGMFCDPQLGGNKDGLGWASIGFLMHPPRPGDCHPGVEDCGK